ncbi:alkane hydroxylase MAH1-like [Coffea arabica]|uniref:Alkane hydroxylase MAH1-like n=1 Tax=Coffea arabica TaxID=13443 RepID=A0ABM4UAU6_COFAR
MAIIIQSYLETLPMLLLCFVILLYYYYNLTQRWKRSSLPTTWPVVGMLPALLQNSYRLHDYGTEVLKESGGTFQFKGPWFANMDMVITCDPANVHYILTKNFSNYPKGPDFRKIFDVLGDGIFNADSELWEAHRKITLSVMRHPNFQKLLETTLRDKLEEGLFPILETCAKTGSQLDLQEIFQRFTFDNISKVLLDHDPGSLSMDLPYIPCEKAFSDTAKALLHRHLLPESCWKLQKWLGIGHEKKLGRAADAFEQFICPCISLKQEKRNKTTEETGFDGLSAFMEAYKGINTRQDAKLFMKDIMLNLIFAGRDSTSTALSWLFWLIARNPQVEDKIREEIATKLDAKQGQNLSLFINVQESHKLIYLHGAVCEALRLYPSVALEHKAPAKADTLPSGLRIDANTKLVLSFYSMGRMESIWGDDCLEFRPERWISEHGSIKHEPSFKFPAFLAGPRTCVGKEMAMIQMKMVAASIVYNYHIQVAEGHPISPSDSVIIQMKHGFMVRPFKRN